MSKHTPIEEFLTTIHLERYIQALKNYGIEAMEDLLILTPPDWEALKVMPFHRNKMIHSAASMR